MSKMTSTELPSKCAKSVIEEIAQSEKFKDFKLTVSMGSSAGDNYLGEIYRIIISGMREGRLDDSLALIAKIAPNNPALRKDSFIQQFYRREAAIYTQMLPVLMKVQAVLPEDDRFYHAKLYTGVVDEGNEMLVMEDLCVKGFKMYDRLKPFDYDHLALSVKSLARLHATSIALKAKDTKKYDELCKLSIKAADMGDAFAVFMCRNIPNVRKLAENEPYETRVNQCLDNLMEDLEKFFDPAPSAPYNMLCHGDCWSNNMLFQYKDKKVVDLRFLDWQLMRNSSPCTDLSYMLFTSTDTEMRSKHYNDLLNLYYKTLATNVAKLGFDINKFYPELVYRQQLKVYMKYGLLMAFGVLPLTLSNKGEAPDMSDLISSSDEDFQFSAACSERIKGLLEDCAKYNII